MDDVLKTVVSGLAVAAVGAVTFVAYRHPSAYLKLNVGISTIVSAMVLGAMIWNLSNQTASFAISEPMLPWSEVAKARDLVEAKSTPGWWIIVGVALMGYLVFLRSFPAWLLPEKPPERDDKPPKRVDDQKR